ncbi:MAG: TAXI family TRAP transporter solute-binding subunit [Pseudolabrys sp.]|nr:TAXI family TRAP transporter solute-binding subunit [Pseudolabrys sp.]MCW5683392.1 TAXI family TRAP transporter solute-binding subunit [Pseudolabrys sp.]
MTITRRQLQSVAIGCAALLLGAGAASAQTFGFATMQPGTLNHTTGSAIAKVLKDKANINAVIQPTAGESVLIPLVGRGEAEFGIANIFEVEGAKAANKDLRLIGSIQALRGAYFVRKDSGMKTMADLKGKRVVFGYSAMKTIDPLAKAMLMTGGLTEKDIKPVLVPNVIRGADEFAAGNADMFFFAFGAPKVREVDATVGGILALEVPESGMPEAKKILAGGYLTMVQPNPFYVGVPKAMNVYTWDNMLFTNSKVSDDVVYKLIDTMVKNKDDMLTIQPALREFTAAGLYKKYDIPYHPGALKYFNEHKIDAKSVN